MGLFKEGLVNEPPNQQPSAPCASPDSALGMGLCGSILRDFLLERTDRWKDGKDRMAKCATVGNSHRSSGKRDSRSLGGEGGQPCLWEDSLHSSFIHTPDVEQMAIDWLTGNFYFVDDIDDRIFVCNRNGDTCVTLLDLELYNPKGIALDPTMG